jgi:hypothetical protein
VTFAPGSSTATIAITPLDDGRVGGGVTVTIDLTPSTSDSYVVDANSSSATVTIYDNDLPTVGVWVSQSTAQERGGAPGQFTVSLANNVVLDYSLVVPYTLSGSAVNGES